jgi:D-3-phosphoglycerate dehydrogenase / 2-oxoglutarate reductase
MADMRIFVADDVNDAGLAPLRDAGFTIDKRTGLKGPDLLDAVIDATGLIVRSETKVTRELMNSAIELRVIGRAGVGVDNIDVPAATENGIVVMNAPDGNTITTAEHTIAMLVSLARNIPQADASLKGGKWERKKFVGVELQAKTLGVIGLGRIGRVVANRAKGFGMRIVAFDPFTSPEQARDLEIELLKLEEVFARADFLTIHTPLTSETRGIIGESAFARMKKGVRVLNCARGGLIDEAALVNAINDGTVAGAGMDVFEDEPPEPANPLLHMDNVIVTPHLGASTKEAQEGVAVTVAEQMRDYLLTGTLKGAVNAPAVAASEMNVLHPYIALANSLGRLQAQLIEQTVRSVRLEYAGELADLEAATVTRAFLAGLLRNVSARVNAVNSMLIAEERGIGVSVTYLHGGFAQAHSIRATVSTDGGTDQSAAGTLLRRTGGEFEGRITEINSFRLEAKPRGYMLLTRNHDIPGVIGKIGTVIGEKGINISNFHLGRRERGGEAMAVIETDSRPDQDTVDSLSKLDEVIFVRAIEL